MDILGYEIDPSFVYIISPIDSWESDAKYYAGFRIRFKDGRTHHVEINKEKPESKLRKKLAHATITNLRDNLIMGMDRYAK